MNIIEAMDAMDRGEKVRHASFDDGWYCCKVEPGYLLNGNLVCPLDMTSATQVKFLREGWSIVREQFDFAEAVRRVQSGKRVYRASWYASIADKNLTVANGGWGASLGSMNSAVTLEDTQATDWEEA